MSAGQAIAAGIPNAQFIPLEGEVHAYMLGQTEPILTAIDEFLNAEVPSQRAVASAQPSSDVLTILFTDMEGSTTLADRLGDAVAQEVRRAHNDIVRSALAANGGNEIKHTGDGIMASFATASSALDAAIAIQRGVAEHKQEHPDSPLGVYIGLNAGEPIAEEDPDGRVDLFGTSVNLAARICDHAEAGQILAANVVRELAAGKQFLFADLGETELRGFEDPVKLWELRWQPEGSP
ncbi:MAG: adenylate/guanylate cyclase domain-containing protein [Chloroflexi bacterium]|nr:adenylate/guanylate cyclase domain-containing protein [Chloroflexota bacterium]